MALAYRHGKLPDAPAKVKQVAKNMDDEQLKHYTQTPSKKLPEKKATELPDVNTPWVGFGWSRNLALLSIADAPWSLRTKALDQHLRNTGPGEFFVHHKTASAVIVTGNPKYVANNPKAEEFYANLEKLLQGQGYNTARDPGAEHTEPAPADLWVGHSRGADRLRWAPSSTKTLALGSGDEGAINNPEDQAFLEGNEPGDPHFTLTPEMEAAIIAKVKREPTTLDQLLQAKSHSDKKEYGAKRKILAALMRKFPDQFVMDSPGRFAGITHQPTNFKLHVDRSVIPAGVKQANGLQTFFAGLSKRRGLLGQVGKHFEANPQHAGWITQGPEKKPLLATFRDPSTGSNFSLQPGFTPLDFAKKLRTMRNSYRPKQPLATTMPKMASQMLKQAVGVSSFMSKLRRGSRVPGLSGVPSPISSAARTGLGGMAPSAPAPQSGFGKFFSGLGNNLMQPLTNVRKQVQSLADWGVKRPSNKLPTLPEDYGWKQKNLMGTASGGESNVFITPERVIKHVQPNQAGGEMLGMTQPLKGNLYKGFDMGLDYMPEKVTHDFIRTRNLVPELPQMKLLGRTAESGSSVIEQPYIHGTQPDYADIMKWMDKHKVQSLPHAVDGVNNLTQDIPRFSGVARVKAPKLFGVLPRDEFIRMADINPNNFIKTVDGQVKPIDIMAGRMGHLEAAKHLPRVRQDLLLKLMGGAALTGGGIYGAGQLGAYSSQQ